MPKCSACNQRSMRMAELVEFIQNCIIKKRAATKVAAQILLTFRRKRVISVRVLFANSAVKAMNYQFGFLIANNFSNHLELILYYFSSWYNGDIG